MGGKMFGTQSLNQQSNDDPAMLDNVKQLAQDPANTIVPSSPPPVLPPQTPPPASSPFTPTTVPAQSQQDGVATTDEEHRAEPAEGFSSSPLPDDLSSSQVDPVSAASSYIPATDENDTNSDDDNDSDASATDEVQPVIQSTSAPIIDTSQDSHESSDTTGSNDAPQAIQQAIQSPNQEHLAGLKQQALQHLEPLSEHIDGTPEETFKTTMMMIQANDNHTLLEKALEAAKKIEDDKIRAKAMLDVINEINYFSSQNDSANNPAS